MRLGASSCQYLQLRATTNACWKRRECIPAQLELLQLAKPSQLARQLLDVIVLQLCGETCKLQEERRHSNWLERTESVSSEVQCPMAGGNVLSMLPFTLSSTNSVVRSKS